MNFTTQVHDFDPGITPYPGGLFWIVPLPADGNVDVNFGAGRARMTVNHLPAFDFFNIPNALLRFQTPVSVPANVSYDIQWSGPVTSRGPVTSPAGSTGQLVMSNATMTWSATNSSGFSFTSNPHPTTSVFAQLGHVTNGVFAGSA